LIEETHSEGARYSKICHLLGISRRTLERWKGIGIKDKRKGAPKKVVRKLSEEQERAILITCNSLIYRDQNPYEIVPDLLNQGSYLGSVSTFYRVLRVVDQVHHRSNSNVNRYHAKPPERRAIGSNEVWCWDITWMARDVKGLFYYAYVIIDIFDRSIVGWAIHEHEEVAHSQALFTETMRKHQVSHIAVHADNGHPMKGISLMAFFQQLEVKVSHNRPRTSNDNPYIESWFKTMKYKASYPHCFASIEHAREWMAAFVNWYNHDHQHSRIGYVTPYQMRSGEAVALFAQRNETMQSAYQQYPERWGSRALKVWQAPQEVVLNPDSAENRLAQQSGAK